MTVWMCLRCGLQLCDSNSTSDHFRKHHEVPRSDLHCVGLNVNTWRLWCVECDAEVAVDSYKKVREAVDFVRRVEETKGRAAGASASTGAAAAANSSSPSSSSSAKAKSHSSRFDSAGASLSCLPRPRGLSNLGNTCFFNAVMQSLSRTHPLSAMMDAHAQKGAAFALPEVRVPPAPLPESEGHPEDMEVSVAVEARAMSKEGAVMEATSLRLSEAGPMAMALAAFLKEMNSLGKQGVYNPGFLFGKVASRSPQFRGFHQHDAHELLRHLLEGIRSEETKRQKAAILRHFGLSEKTDPKTVPWATRRKLQALGRHGSHTAVDRVFGGHLVSTVVCEECHNSSQIFEPFLDLSLPLVEEKPQRPAPKKGKHSGAAAAAAAANSDDEKASTTTCCGSSGKMSKKERRKMKKEKRRMGKNKKQNLSEGEEKTVAKEVEDNREVENKDQDQEEKAQVAVDDDDDDNDDDDTEERKLRKELEENEKGLSKSPASERSAEDRESLKDSERLDNSRDSGMVASKMSVFDPSKRESRKTAGKEPQDGNEEDDEDDGYSEEDEDWEWDYGEEWEEGNSGAKQEEGEKEQGEEDKSVYLEVDEEKRKEEERPKVSLNPLPPERLLRGSSERDRSSDQTGDAEGDDDEEEATDCSTDDTSIAGDVEDNLDDNQKASSSVGREEERGEEEDAGKEGEEEENVSFRHDPEHLDPHMEELCRKVRDVSVASVHVRSSNGNDGIGGGNFVEEDAEANVSRRYSVGAPSVEDEVEDDGAEKLRLRNDWVARYEGKTSTRLLTFFFFFGKGPNRFVLATGP